MTKKSAKPKKPKPKFPKKAMWVGLYKGRVHVSESFDAMASGVKLTRVVEVFFSKSDALAVYADAAPVVLRLAVKP